MERGGLCGGRLAGGLREGMPLPMRERAAHEWGTHHGGPILAQSPGGRRLQWVTMSKGLLDTVLLGKIGHGPARVLNFIYFAGAGLLIFVLPYHVPMKHVVFSISYDFGFNNRVAVLGALFSMLAIPFFVGRDAERTTMTAAPPGEPPLSKYPLFLMAALHMAGIAFYFLVTLVEPGTPDGSYFLSHAINMAHGLRPYIDFEYAYGPGLVYPTHWLTMTGLSAHTAYFLFYLAISFAGLCLAWSFAALLPVRNSLKLLVFLMICGISFVSLTTVGVSYTIVRFVTPLWVLGKVNEADERGHPVWRQALMACAGILFVDLVSQEIGTVLAVTAAVFFGFTCFGDSRARVARVMAMLSCLAAHGIFFFALMPSAFRSSMLTFAAGGNNFPVIPSLLDVLYLLCFAYCFKRHIPPSGERSLIFPLIVVFALGSMAAALTHADAGHIVWDGLGIFVLAMVADGSKPRSSRFVLAFAPVLLFALGDPYCLRIPREVPLAEEGAGSLLSGGIAERLVLSTGHLLHVHPERLVERMHGGAEVVAQQRLLRDREAGIAAEYPSSVFFSADYELQERLADINLKPTYYFTLANVFTPESVERAVEDLRKSDASILISGDDRMQPDCPTEDVEKIITSVWLDFPYNVRRKHDSCQIYAPIYAYVREHYQQMPADKTVWVNKDLSVSSQASASPAR